MTPERSPPQNDSPASMSLDCPSSDELVHLLRGTLSEQRIETMSEHVDGCPECQRRVERLEVDDPLASELSQLSDRCRHGTDRGDDWWLRSLSATDPTGSQDVAGASLPREIDPYRVIEKIAVGGMSTVYLVRHRRLGKPFALKLLHPGNRLTAAGAARVRREWRMHGSLTHPNIVGATDAGVVNGQPFLVTERIDGVDLSRLLRQQGPLRPADACEIARQAAVGLQHAHDQGIIHRDVKPSNLMLQRDGTVKILDLGTAYWPDEGPPAEDLLHGTLAYMAPEQLQSSPRCDPRSDLYALGCTLSFLLIGEPPFGNLKGQTRQALVEAHRSESPPPLNQRVPDPAELPSGVVAVVERLLAKDPSERFESMGELAATLAPLAAAHRLGDVAARIPQRRAAATGDVSKTGALTSLWTSGPGRIQRQLRVWVPITLVGLAVVVLVFAISGRDQTGSLGLTPGSRPAATAGGAVPDDTPVFDRPEDRIAESGRPVWPTGEPSQAIDGIVPRPSPWFDGIDWQIETRAPRGAVVDVAWSPDGQTVAATSADGRLRWYRFHDGKLELDGIVARREHDFADIDWHPTKPWIAAASRGGLCVIDASNGTIRTRDARRNGTRTVAWHPAGELLGVATRSGILLVEPEQMEVVDRSPQADVFDFDWSPDGSHLVATSLTAVRSLGFDGERFATTPDSVKRCAPGRECYRVRWVPSGDEVALLRRFSVERCDSKTLELRSTIQTPLASSVDFRHDGEGLVAYQAKVGRFTDVPIGQPSTFAAQQRGHLQIAWAPRGRHLAVGMNGAIAILDRDLNEVTSLGGNHLIAAARGIRDGGVCAVTQDGRTVVLRRDGSIAHFDNISRGSQRTVVGFTMVEPGLRLFVRPAIGERFEIRLPLTGQQPPQADGPLVASIFNRISRYDAESQTWEYLMPNPGGADGVQASPDGLEMVCLDHDATVKFVSLKDQRMTRQWQVEPLATAHSLHWHAASGIVIVTGKAADRDGTCIVGARPGDGEVLWTVSDPSLGPTTWCVPTGERTFLHAGRPFQQRDALTGEVTREIDWTGRGSLDHHRVERATGSDRFQSWSGLASDWISEASAVLLSWDVKTLQPVWAALGVGASDWVVISPSGQLIDATAEAERHLVWLVEGTEGIELLRGETFDDRVSRTRHP